MKLLIMGLPGAGKTTLAKTLVHRIGAVHFNADAVRENINKDLGFTEADRIEQATRMGWLCDRVVESGGIAVADFICPTEQTRAAFDADFTVFVARIDKGRFEDTNRIFEPPSDPDGVVTADVSPEFWAEKIATAIRPPFDWTKPTAFFLGRYQPFHDGHRALVLEGIRRTGQACIAVRSMQPDEKNPFDFEYVKSRIEQRLSAEKGRFVVLPLPNVTQILYGRDVGYSIEQIHLGEEMESISATNERAKMGQGK